MLKNIIILGLLGMLAVIGWRYYAAHPSSTATSTAETAEGKSPTKTTSTPKATTTPTAGTLPAIFTRGGNYTCAINVQQGNAQTNIVIDVSGVKTRMELRGRTMNGITSNTIIVHDGTWVYTWTEGMLMGTKTRITATTPIIPATSGGGVSANLNSSVGWDCHPWIVKAEMLAPPPEVAFTAQ
jgi:hypothetical protein